MLLLLLLCCGGRYWCCHGIVAVVGVAMAWWLLLCCYSMVVVVSVAIALWLLVMPCYCGCWFCHSIVVVAVDLLLSFLPGHHCVVMVGCYCSIVAVVIIRLHVYYSS